MRSQFRNLVAWLFIGDLLLTQLALFAAEFLRQAVPIGKYIPPGETLYDPIILHAVILIIWPVVFVSLGVYDVRRTAQRVGEARLLVAALLTAVLASGGVLYFSYREVPRLMVGYFVLFDLFSLALLRFVIGLVVRYRQSKGLDLVRVLVVGANELGAAVAGALSGELGQGFVWVGFVDDDPSADGLPLIGKIEDVPGLVQQKEIDEVIIALPSVDYSNIESLVHSLQAVPVRIRIVPDFFRLAMVKACVDDLCGIPLIGIREPLIDGARWATKRAFDLVLGGLAVIVSSPLLAAIALAVRLDSVGPVLFRQQRVGENGRLFWMYKFRTMVHAPETHEVCGYVPARDGTLQPVYKRSGDPRITRVGRLLRRMSLDELPQLINVLRGEMSVVGPRPEQAFIAEQYRPWQRQRLVVPPGITGWWQVSGRGDLPMHLNTEYDLFYVRNYSIWLDLKILWRTVGAVIRGRGAY